MSIPTPQPDPRPVKKRVLVPWNLREAVVTTSFAFCATSTSILVFTNFLKLISIDPNYFFQTFFQLAIPAAICCFTYTLLFFPSPEDLNNRALFKIAAIVTMAIIIVLTLLIATSSPKLCHELAIGRHQAYIMVLKIFGTLAFFVTLANSAGALFYVLGMRPLLVRLNIVLPLAADTGVVCKI